MQDFYRDYHQLMDSVGTLLYDLVLPMLFVLSFPVLLYSISCLFMVYMHCHCILLFLTSSSSYQYALQVYTCGLHSHIAQRYNFWMMKLETAMYMPRDTDLTNCFQLFFKVFLFFYLCENFFIRFFYLFKLFFSSFTRSKNMCFQTGLFSLFSKIQQLLPESFCKSLPNS